MKRLLFISVICFSASLAAQPGKTDWPLFRGNAALDGKAETTLPASPKLLWSYTGGARTVSSPVTDGKMIFFGDNNGVLHAVTADGKPAWKVDTETTIEAAPIISGNMVIYGSLDGKLRALDTKTGKEVWTYATENQISGSANIVKGPKGPVIIVGSYDYNLHSVDAATGKGIWKFETDNFINGTPAISSDMIVFGGCDGFLRIVNSLTGLEVRNNPVDVYIAASPALTSDRVYVGDYEGSVYCFDLKTGQTIWKAPGKDETSVITATPAVSGNRVMIGNEDKNFYCFDAANRKTAVGIPHERQDNRQRRYCRQQGAFRVARFQSLYPRHCQRKGSVEI
ncbi:MAG: PQQ-binding-like beta-propeller repeat protein [Marinilabiliales bacterium]|nr:PQQ-binding-like beta-propeller repeat protein [Marinilabiliales bacterium]